MLPVHGFYGHVQRNDLLSVAMFAGFLLALQLMAAVALFLPLLIYDFDHSPIYNFAGYAKRYAPLICTVGAGLFLVQFFLHVRLVRVRAEFVYVNRITDPRLCNIVETLAIGAGLPCPKVGLIDTDARNAFACGIANPRRWWWSHAGWSKPSTMMSCPPSWRMRSPISATATSS